MITRTTYPSEKNVTSAEWENKLQHCGSSLSLKHVRIDTSSSKSLFKVLCTKTALKNLNLSHTFRNENASANILPFLQGKPSLTSLNMAEVAISKVTMVAFATILEENTTLQHLKLNALDSSEPAPSDNRMRLFDGLVTPFGLALVKNSTLRTLEFDSCLLSHLTASSFAEGLKQNASLTRLSLSCNWILGIGAKALMNSLTNYNSSLQFLNLSENSITNEVGIDVANLFKNNNSLTDVNLSNNPDLGNDAAQQIAESLIKNTSLTSLNLGETGIEDAGAFAFAKLLTVNLTLTTLKLDNNRFTDAGIISIASALCTNSTLTTLKLDNNPITDAGIISIASALCDNSTLTSLGLSNTPRGANMITSAAVIAIAESLTKNTSLESLEFRGYANNNQTITAFANTFTVNSSLTHFALDLCPLENTVKTALLDALFMNSSLTSLLISANEANDKDAVSAAFGISDRNQHNYYMRTLDLQILSWEVIAYNALDDKDLYNDAFNMLPLTVISTMIRETNLELKGREEMILGDHPIGIVTEHNEYSDSDDEDYSEDVSSTDSEDSSEDVSSTDSEDYDQYHATEDTKRQRL